MLIYCGLMAVILGIGCIFKVKETKKKQRLFIIFIFTLCALIASLRSFNVGIDTLQYYRNYYTIGSIEWGNYDSVRYEFGTLPCANYLITCHPIHKSCYSYRLLFVVIP